jgi:hypothetical protein
MEEAIFRPEQGHQRYLKRNGEEVTGCSTIAKVNDDFEGLIGWANGLGLKGINCFKQRDSDADAGNVAHFMIHCHFKRLKPNFRKVSQDAIETGEQVFQKFMTWWVDKELTFVATEVELVSEIYSYGGTLDLAAKDPKGRIWIIDIKTSKKINFGHLCQLAGLGQLWDENYTDKPSSELWIARLPRGNGKVEGREVSNREEVFETFLAQLNFRNKKFLAGGY